MQSWVDKRFTYTSRGWQWNKFWDHGGNRSAACDMIRSEWIYQEVCLTLRYLKTAGDTWQKTFHGRQYTHLLVKHGKLRQRDSCLWRDNKQNFSTKKNISLRCYCSDSQKKTWNNSSNRETLTSRIYIMKLAIASTYKHAIFWCAYKWSTFHINLSFSPI